MLFPRVCSPVVNQQVNFDGKSMVRKPIRAVGEHATGRC